MDAAFPGWLPVGAALALAAVHVVTPSLRFPGGTPRSVWLSIGGSRREPATPSPGVFWVHVASFGLYNLLMGYLLVHGELTTPGAHGFFAVAMALHFLVTDFGLVEDHKAPHRPTCRWVLVGAVAAGVAVGYAVALPEATIAVLVAFRGRDPQRALGGGAERAPEPLRGLRDGDGGLYSRPVRPR